MSNARITTDQMRAMENHQHFNGLLNVCYPYKILEPVLDKFN
ncbi:MAG: hypothetical protein O7G87_05900 [bacterium]|nr:hypothetical protein [bacterium]